MVCDGCDVDVANFVLTNLIYITCLPSYNLQYNKMCLLLSAAMASVVASALMASKKKSARVLKTLYNEKGEMDSWTGATKFQNDLIKNLVKKGLVANLNVDEVKVNYPAFKGFSNACLSNKLSNLKRTFNKNVDKRGKSKFDCVALTSF